MTRNRVSWGGARKLHEEEDEGKGRHSHDLVECMRFRPAEQTQVRLAGAPASSEHWQLWETDGPALEGGPKQERGPEERKKI